MGKRHATRRRAAQLLLVRSERRDSARGDFCFAATHRAILLRDLRAVLGPHVGVVARDGISEFRALIEEAGAAAEGLLVGVATVPPVWVAAAGRALAEAFEKALRGQVVDHQTARG
jgi:hypothetical protein